ncbi:GDSL-type esterase/lipase family protein [Sandaracinus amylolyticus]|uniref:GDSL-type esterase/lipase family protein n=1 Tax=Sandaracinus amylolyticus TaxID=927083 RepID=UPI001F2C8BAA|nr:GDSL-type esterase/lipase family protein [Sandaracinus amylolyticus]UJR79651.1 Hypothetical protein I5071_16890 [Sandaracinus amylolyticus]
MPLAPTSPGELARAALDDLPRRPTDGLTGDLVLEDPSGHALDALHAALARAARGEHTARLSFYGGSHTASDLYTGVIRARLQQHFGDAGHGFVLAMPPIDRYWQQGVRIADAEGWTMLQPSSKRMGVEHYGLAGMAFEATEPAWAEVETEHGASASRIEIMYLRQPGGGALEVEIDGEPARVLDTASETIAPAIERIEVPLGSHRVSLRTRSSAPVRVFGVVLERDRPGVIVDQLAIAGAKARHQLLWDEATWSALWSPRPPDFVALSYGNNELDDHHLTFAQHEQHFVDVIGRVRRHSPDASCLVIGPSDRQVRGVRGEWKSPGALPLFVAMQRRIAHAHGCAFVDVLAWQGGPGAVERWLASDPPLERDDRMHFTEQGYRRLGADLLRVLLAGMAAEPR